MVGLYVFGGVIVVVMVAVIFFRVRWGREAKVEARLREARIEKERSEEAR